MNVNELTDLIVKITRSNKKQQYSRALAGVINDEKGAPVFDTLDYVFNAGDDQPSMPKGKYRLGDVAKIVNKNGSGGYFPYYLLLNKEQYDKFGREIQYMKNGQCFYTEAIGNEMLDIVKNQFDKNHTFYPYVKDSYGFLSIIELIVSFIDTSEGNNKYGAESFIITYDGVPYKYDKNNIIIESPKNESVSAQSFNLLNQEA